jgi:hypothetical protein
LVLTSGVELESLGSQPRAVLAGDHPEAILLYFMQPRLAQRWLWG